MTQVLTLCGPAAIVQMTDRLVTFSQAGETVAHDTTANKTVVFRAMDALVTVSFAGLAYIGNQPTDEWIAEQLYGGSVRTMPVGHTPGFRLGGQSLHRKIGMATMHLWKALDELRGLDGQRVDQHGMWIQMAGWQHDRHMYVRPLQVDLCRHGGKTEHARSKRHAPRGRDVFISGIGMSADGPFIREAMGSIEKPAQGPRFSPAAVEPMMAEAIRRMSGLVDTVGAHLLSVVLPRPGTGVAYCHFLPITPHTIGSGSTARNSVEVAFSPWIVGGNILFEPSIEVGDTQLWLYDTPFNIRGGVGGAGVLSLSWGQVRPPPPGRHRVHL